MSAFERLLGLGHELERAFNDDAEVAARLPVAQVTIGIGIPATTSARETQGIAVRFETDSVTVAPFNTADTAMTAPTESWDRCLSANPEPPFHHFLGMRMRVAEATISGDEVVFAQHAHLARRMVELSRAVVNSASGSPAETGARLRRSGIRGRYIEASVEGHPVDLYVEEVGGMTSPSILVLHTAGADSRQAHALMSESELTRSHRIIAFDLPDHGRSDTTTGPGETWSLTQQRYIESVLAVIDALELDRPILLGASMAGEACLAMALHSPERLGGVIACEAAEHVPGRATPWPKDPRVNSMLFTPEWIDGLIAPGAPTLRRDEIKRQYSQGGFGVFSGDIEFYSGGWDARGSVGAIDTTVCPVIMMTGEYDYSCTPSMSAATAAQIPGAVFWEMPGLGHFPLTEHPTRFAPHLRRALDEIASHRV